MGKKKFVTFSKYSTISNGNKVNIILTKIESNHNTLANSGYYSYINDLTDQLYAIKSLVHSLMYNVSMI